MMDSFKGVSEDRYFLWSDAPVGYVLRPIGEGQDNVSQRRQRQTPASSALSGPAHLCLTAPQVQEVEAAPSRH